MKNQKQQQEITQEELSIYLTARDIENIATQSGKSIQTIRAIVRCVVAKSPAMALCLQVAKARKDEMQRKAMEIVENKM